MARPKMLDDFDELAGARGGTPDDQENYLAKVMNGKRQRGSGASQYAKGDATSEYFLGECKLTGKQSIRIQEKALTKITAEALAVGKRPCLHFQIQGEAKPMLERDWVAVPMSVFKAMLRAFEMAGGDA